MQEELVYKTIQNDTWDLISFKLFGTEDFSTLIAKNNPTYLKLIKLPPGITLKIPKISNKTGGGAPWED